MVLDLNDGTYLHTAFSVTNIPADMTEETFSLTDQDGMRYVGQYISPDSEENSNPSAYTWSELLDTETDDVDSDGIYPLPSEQVQLDALQTQIAILQDNHESLEGSMIENEGNIANASQLSSEALNTAQKTGQYFWHTETGTDAGAHITEIPQEEFLEDPANGGGNLLARSNGIIIRDGLEELSTFGAGGVIIGKETETHAEMANDSFDIIDENSVSIAHLGNPTAETIQDTFYVETERSAFELNATPESLTSVKIDDVEVGSSGYTLSGTTLTMVNPVSAGSVVVITYITAEKTAYYTFGKRKSGGGVGLYSTAEGNNTTSSGKYAHAEGNQSTASGGASHAEGSYTRAIGTSSHAEGSNTIAYSAGSHAEGYGSKTFATRSHAEGDGTQASGYRSHAQNHECIAQGLSSHAQNVRTKAGGEACTSLGSHTCALNAQSVAEGYATVASGYNSHAMGAKTLASRGNQLVIGRYNETSTSNQALDTFTGDDKKMSFVLTYACGSITQVTLDGVTTSDYTYAENVVTFNTAPALGAQIQISYYTIVSDDVAFIIGNGSSDTARSNALTVDWDGNVTANAYNTANGLIGEYKEGSVVTNTVPNNTTTTVRSMTLGKGVWLLSAHVQWTASSSVIFNNNISYSGGTQTARGSMTNGGGVSNLLIVNLTSSETVTLSVWQNTGSSQTTSGGTRFRAVRVG